MNFFRHPPSWNWKSLFTKDWQAKAGSLVVAILLWWFVYSQTSVQRGFYIPIQYINLPPNMVILKTNDTMARVTIQGRKDRIMSLKNHQIRAFVDLSEASPGWYTNQIHLTTTELDPTMSVNLEKTTTTLFVDTIEAVSLPVLPVITDSVEKGYEVASLELRPSSVILKGPSTFLTNLQYIKTMPISLKGLTNSLSTNVELVIPREIMVIDNLTNQVIIHIRPTSRQALPEEEK